MSYSLKVQDNQVIEETGYFFQAAPFTITSEKSTLSVNFERSSNHKVYFKIHENGTLLAELTHPEYVPQQEPETLSPSLKLAIAAFLKTGISKQKNYNDYFDTQSFSYTLTQPQFL